MSYRRIEVNLLPPELQPGPAVRSALLINIALILATLFTIGLSAAFGAYTYAQNVEGIAATKQSIKSLEPVRAGYEQLQHINQAVLNYGKIIGMASTDYVDMPVLLSRLTYIMPQGVYLTQISNSRAGNVTIANSMNPNRPTMISLSFNTSSDDLELIERTLMSLKADPVFRNCALTNATLSSENYTNLAASLGYDFDFTLPARASLESEYNYYEFTIRAEVQRPIDNSNSRTMRDELELFKASAPMSSPDVLTNDSSAGGNNNASEPGVVGGPPGVTGQSNRGGN